MYPAAVVNVVVAAVSAVAVVVAYLKSQFQKVSNFLLRHLDKALNGLQIETFVF
jgi:hypothetical protein